VCSGILWRHIRRLRTELRWNNR